MPTITDIHVVSGEAELYVEQHGTGPDVLMIAGLGDPAEVWYEQIEALSPRFRLTAYDNRGIGRTSAPVDAINIPAMASDAAAIIRALDIGRAHVMGFSGGGMIAQELAITEPELVKSLVICGSFSHCDAFAQARMDAWIAMAESASSPEAFLRSFLTVIYSREAHNDGRVDAWIQETLAFEHPMSDEAFVATVDAFRAHETRSRLHEITAPTLVVAGDADFGAPLAYNQEIVDGIDGAELVVLPGQAHQPFHEIPDIYNALVEEFWDRVA